MAERALCRQTPKVGAGCPNWARPVLCGGRSEMSVPTANAAAQSPTATQRFGCTNLKHSAIAVFLVQHTSKPPLVLSRFLFSAAPHSRPQRDMSKEMTPAGGAGVSLGWTRCSGKRSCPTTHKISPVDRPAKFKATETGTSIKPIIRNYSRYQQRWKHLLPILFAHFKLCIFGHTG
jgi:hypothetical protein